MIWWVSSSDIMMAKLVVGIGLAVIVVLAIVVIGYVIEDLSKKDKKDKKD